MTIAARNLIWGIRRRTIVADVSLDVARGETLGLIGPNGSGKSSLLRLLAGLTRPQAGLFEIEGQDIARLPRRALARQLAFVRQSAATDTNVSVRDAVRLGRTPHRSALSGWSAADEAAVASALARVDMEGRRAQPWQTLSGGEKQRVQIARAPRILFLDEPTNQLDIHHQIAILRMVRGLELTSIVVLHDMNLAAMFCDRIIVLEAGRVVACGTPEAVLTAELLRAVFRVEAEIAASTATGPPHIRFLA